MSATPDSLREARARLDTVRWTCRAALGQLASGRASAFASALVQLEDAFRTYGEVTPVYGADEALLDVLLAATTVASEMAKGERRSELHAEAMRLWRAVLKRRLRALIGPSA